MTREFLTRRAPAWVHAIGNGAGVTALAAFVFHAQNPEVWGALAVAVSRALGMLVSRSFQEQHDPTQLGQTVGRVGGLLMELRDELTILGVELTRIQRGLTSQGGHGAEPIP